MGHASVVTDVAALLGDSTRAAMLDALMDGQTRPAGELAGARARKRAFARACVDWSERRPHLAGALGAALADAALDQGWVRRRPNDRWLRVTPKGAAALTDLRNPPVPRMPPVAH